MPTPMPALNMPPTTAQLENVVRNEITSAIKRD